MCEVTRIGNIVLWGYALAMIAFVSKMSHENLR
jgi:hypothetical protein